MTDAVTISVLTIIINIAIFVVFLPRLAKNKYRLLHRCPRCHSFTSMFEFKTRPLLHYGESDWEEARLCERCRGTVEYLEREAFSLNG